MSSPFRNLSKLKSPRVVSTNKISDTNLQQSLVPCLTASENVKTTSPITLNKKLQINNNNTVSFLKVRKALNLELTELMYHGLKDENKYKVIGKGGFGTVVLLKTKEKDVAVKIVPYLKQIRSLTNEKNAIGLNHVNVVKILDVLINSEATYGLVLMEPWFSLTLHMLIHNSYRPVTPEERIRYLLNLISGLEYCHDMGVIHLDIKPLNVLVDLTMKTCKLCDFGASYNCVNKNNNKYVHNLNHQGTIAYAAPELFKGDEPTFKCDIYSFGITMWQFLHADLPYRGIQKETLIYQIVSFGIRPKCTMLYESEYSELYRQCWNTFPGNRPSTNAIKEKLQSLLDKIIQKNNIPIFQLL